MEAAERDRGGVLRRWLAGLGRILLFFGLYFALVFAGQLALAVMQPRPALLAAFAGTVLVAVAAILGGAVLLRGVDRRPAGALGIAWTRQTPREIAAGFGIGAASLALAAVLMLALGGLRYAGAAGDAAGWVRALAGDLGFFAVAAAAEEALFRGYPFQVLVQMMGAVAATIVASAAFALAHIANPNVSALALVNIFLAGVLLSAAYLRTRSLWFATAVHLGWNWAMGGPFDLPVSGLGLIETPLYEPHTGGPAWLTGGAFGPEGGIVASLAFIAALAAVIYAPGLDASRAMRALRPLVEGRVT